MILMSGRLLKNTKDDAKQSCTLVIKLVCMILIALILAGSSNAAGKAAAGLQIYDYSTKKTSIYTGTQVKATCNGTAIGNSKYPGIIVNGIAMLSLDDVFGSLPIDADCEFSDNNNTISISKYSKKIIMKVGSKKAEVNGKAVTLPQAPMRISYLKDNTVKVLVPSRYVSETLGLGYTWYSSKSTVAIIKHTMELAYNGGAKFEYTGTQGKVTVNGKSVSLGKTPSIIINDTAMLCAYKVFAASGINAQYNYDTTTKTITLKKDSNVLTMTVGSKTAYLNNNPVSLDAAPVYVTNYETNSSYIMVPGRVTATSLGYQYSWNNSKKTSIISSKSQDSDTGNSDDISGSGTTLKHWTALKAYSKSSSVHELNSESASTATGTIYQASRDYSNTSQNAEKFMIISNQPFHKVTSVGSDQKIVLQASNQVCNSQTYQMYGNASNFINTIKTSNLSDSNTTIEFDVVPTKYDYDISLSDDQQILYVTVFVNTITDAIIGTNTSGDYLTLNGISALKTSITKSSNTIQIDLPDTLSSLGDLNSLITGSKYIKQISAVSTQENTQIILTMNDGYKYSTTQKGNQTSISFIAKDGDSNESEDKNYEIVIPKPDNVTSSMITDEDHYLSHYFEICLKGDYREYFKTHSIINKSKIVKKVSVSLNSRGNTVIKITTSKLQGYEIISKNGSIYVNIGNPRDIYKNIVVLDPGHGGGATGAQKSSYNEKDINFKILYTIGKQYFNQDPSKLKVYYTRTSDTDVSLNDRAAFAKEVGADLFVCLHMNSVVNSSSVEGTEVFYSNMNNDANSAGLTSKKLASYFVENLTDALGTNSRGVKQAAFVVIKKNTVPAVLIELGFLTNKKDLSIITNEESQKLAAKTIYETLLQVFHDYPTGR